MKGKLQSSNNLYSDIKKLIDKARNGVVTTVNAATTILYWNIGKRINDDILDNKRAEYGKQIIVTLSRQLTEEYGKGWSEKQLRHCLYIVETFPDYEIVSTLCRELSWSHLKVLMYLKDDIKREFYTEMCRIENWNVRVLNEKIDVMLFERTAISKKPDELIRQEYLRYLEKNDSLKGEESPIGLILCAEGSKEQIELMQLHKSDVRVAEYLTEFPAKELLKEKLHKVIELEKKRLQIKKNRRPLLITRSNIWY